MWVQAGQRSTDFWDETPQSFQVAMKGVRRAKEIEAEQRFQLAYETAALVATAQAGKLKKFEHYTKEQPGAVATPKGALAAITSMGSGTMKVRKIKRGES